MQCLSCSIPLDRRGTKFTLQQYSKDRQQKKRNKETKKTESKETDHKRKRKRKETKYLVCCVADRIGRNEPQKQHHDVFHTGTEQD